MLDVVVNEVVVLFFFFFFNDTATTEIYTLSLHDALPISGDDVLPALERQSEQQARQVDGAGLVPGRERSEEHTSELQSQSISYAVFCLKKKKITTPHCCHHNLIALSRSLTLTSIVLECRV